MFFLLETKTAYELRIRDWSSDVCSSDLDARACRHLSGSHRHLRHRGKRRRLPTGDPGCGGRRCVRQPAGGARPERRGTEGQHVGDRKSAEEGKRVSVRVDIGGCRNVKKKNSNKCERYYTLPKQ